MTQLIYYIGQDVGLTTTVLDDTGTPAYGSPTTLTVTAPDGTVTTPATVSTGVGTYSAVVPSVQQAGIYVCRWTATNVGLAFATGTQFQVRAVGVEQLVDLASVKAHLNIPANDKRQDDELQGFILAAADLARDHCGPFLPETHTQYFDGGVSSVSPDWLPVSKVLSCTEYYGLSAYPLTEEPLGAQMDAFAFTVDYSTGTITRRTFGGEAATFAYGTKNIKLVYTAGRSGVIPYTVRLGALELIRHLWQQTQQGGRPKFGGASLDGDSTGIPMGFALPTRVIELWSPFRRAPGIA
jgi:hypothetical protein